MSNDDIIAENRMSKAAYSVTGLPLLGMTAGTDRGMEWSFLDKGQLKDELSLKRIVNQYVWLVNSSAKNFFPSFKPNTESKYKTEPYLLGENQSKMISLQDKDLYCWCGERGKYYC